MTSSDSGHVWYEPCGRSGWTINGRPKENGGLDQSRFDLDPLGPRMPWLGARDLDTGSVNTSVGDAQLLSISVQLVLAWQLNHLSRLRSWKSWSDFLIKSCDLMMTVLIDASVIIYYWCILFYYCHSIWVAYLSDTDISLIDSCSKSRYLMLFYVACPSSSIYELGLVP